MAIRISGEPLINDNGEWLGNVGRRYKKVTHKEMVTDFTTELQKRKINLSDINIHDRIFENGSKATRTIVWNDIKANVGTDTKEDWVNMRLDIANSVNGDWSFQAFVGAYREMCLNTLVFGGEKWYHEKSKHTTGIDTFASAEKVVETINLFDDRMEDLKNGEEHLLKQNGLLIFSSLLLLNENENLTCWRRKSERKSHKGNWII